MGLIRTLCGGLLRRALLWFLWSAPVATKSESKPKPPRRPKLAIYNGVIPEDLLAIVRLSWYKNGCVRHVEEARLDANHEAMLVLEHLVNEALEQGVDVTMICSFDPEDIGITA